MKRLLLSLIFIFTALTFSLAANSKIDSTRSAGTDTVATSQIADSQDDANDASNNKFTFSFDSGQANDTIICIVAIIIVFGVPVFIIFMILWFRLKNKKAKYALAQKALEAGQAIPTDFFKEQNTFQYIKNKGIRNICLGIGLGVFLQVLTDELGLAAIGFLVFCVGVGQIIIAYTSRNHDDNKNSTENSKNISKEICNSVEDMDKE